MNIVKIIKGLQSSGYKITPVRSSLIEVILESTTPLSVVEIKEMLKTKGLNPNKTTVYREVGFLKNFNVLKEIDFGDGKKRYEILQNHHHHIVCIKCSKINDVQMEKDLNKEEKKILKGMGFKPIGHSLEFFGLCSNCQ